MKGKNRKHVGLREDRNEHNYAERVFSEYWKQENKRMMCVNSGLGALECILPDKPSQRDADIAATIIQWFGTGIGKAFLMQAEYRIELIREIDSRLHHLLNNLNVSEDHRTIKFLKNKKELIFKGQSVYRELEPREGE